MLNNHLTINESDHLLSYCARYLWETSISPRTCHIVHVHVAVGQGNIIVVVMEIIPWRKVRAVCLDPDENPSRIESEETQRDLILWDPNFASDRTLATLVLLEHLHWIGSTVFCAVGYQGIPHQGNQNWPDSPTKQSTNNPFDHEPIYCLRVVDND